MPKDSAEELIQDIQHVNIICPSGKMFRPFQL